jgi:hypothetical protein
MVTIHPLEGLHRHAEEASCFPGRHSALRQPRGAGVPQTMRGHVGTQASGSANRSKRLIDPADRLAIPFDCRMDGNLEPFPPPEVGKQPRREAHRRLPLFRLAPTGGPAIEDTIFKVNPSLALGGIQGGAAESSSSAAGLQRQQDEPSHVLRRSPLGDRAMLRLPEAPSSPQ